MSKQFSLLATDKDLISIQKALLLSGVVNLFTDTSCRNLMGLTALTNMAIPAEQAGATSLLCYLGPRHLKPQIFIDKQSEVKTSVNITKSSLIECWRPLYDAKVMRAGRFYFQNRYVEDDQWVSKDDDFCKWADNVFRVLKKNLTKTVHEKVTYFAGEHALQMLLTGKIKII